MKLRQLFPVLGLIFLLPYAVFAEESDLGKTLEERAQTFLEQEKQGAISVDELQQTIDLITKEAKSLTGQTLKNAILLLKLKDDAAKKSRTLNRLDSDISEAKTKLQEIYDKTATLREELAAINRTTKLMEAKLRGTRMKMAETESHIAQATHDIAEKREAFIQEKKRFSDVLRLLYMHKLAYGTGGTLQTNIFKILLADSGTAKVMRRAQALSSLEKVSMELFRKLVEEQAALEQQEQSLQEKHAQLDVLHTELLLEEQDIKAQEEAKKKLLELTRGEERLFQELLIYAQREQAQVTLELQNLRDNVQFINEKLETLKHHFDPKQFEYIVEERAKAARELGISVDLGRLAVVTELEWPVLPKRGISAYFRDPSYQRFFGVRHNAVDIRTPQGTPIHAPAPGLVYRVHDGGETGYSYLILAHPGGIQTVYGHVLEFSVEENDFVTQGQIIGYTGGTPGSHGAGWMTTGPHLHFEVLANGRWVDPLQYLPMELLPQEYRPEPVSAKQ